jgi:hypothetical protein
MAIEVDRLVATLEANFSKYDRALSKLQADSDASFSKVESRGKEMETRLSKLGVGGSLFAGVGAGIAGGLIASFSFDKVKDAIKDVADIGKIAEQVGTTTDALQELRYAAEKADAPVGAIDQALVVFGQHLSQAASGKLNDFSRILAANGIALRDQAGDMRSQSDLFADYADLIKNAASQQDRLRLAQTAFGEAGTGLVNTLRNGSDGLRDMATEAHELGRVLSVDAVNAAQQLDSDFDSIINSMDYRFKSLVVSVVQGAAEMKRAFDSTMAAYGQGDVGGQSLETLLAAKEKLEDSIARSQSSKKTLFGLLSPGADTQIAKTQARLDQINDQIAQIKANTPPPPPDTPPGGTTVIPPPPNRHHGIRLTADQKIDEDIQGVRDRAAALQEEAAAVGLSYQEQERRRMALDLEQEALKRLRQEAARKGQTDLDAIKLSPEQIAKIDAASDAYARQAEELRKLRENQQIAQQAASEFYDTFKSDAIDAVTGARTLADALEDIGKKLANMLLNSAFDTLFKPKSGNSTGGIFGDIFGALGNLLGGFGGARANGGPVEAGKAYLVNENTPRSELFVPGVSGTILPHEAAAKIAPGSTGVSPVTIAPVFNVDASGAGPGVGAEVDAALKKAMDNLTPAVAKSLREIKLKGIRV